MPVPIGGEPPFVTLPAAAYALPSKGSTPTMIASMLAGVAKGGGVIRSQAPTEAAPPSIGQGAMTTGAVLEELLPPVAVEALVLVLPLESEVVPTPVEVLPFGALLLATLVLAALVLGGVVLCGVVDTLRDAPGGLPPVPERCPVPPDPRESDEAPPWPEEHAAGSVTIARTRNYHRSPWWSEG